jgi:transposase-like protein
MTPVLLAHLYALRSHIEAVILLGETELGVAPSSVGADPGSCPQCGASSDNVEDRSTLDGTKRDRCTKCGAEWERFPAES